MIKNSGKSCSFSLVHVAEIASLYIWVLKKFHGFPASRGRIEILCIDYRALVTLGSQCWQKEEVEKFFPFLLPLRYPPFIAFGLQSVSLRANSLFSTCRSQSSQLRGARDLWGFFHASKPCSSVSVSLSGWYTLYSIPSEKKGWIMVTGMLCSCLHFGVFFSTCNQAAKPSVTKCVIWYAGWLFCSWKVCWDHNVLRGHI